MAAGTTFFQINDISLGGYIKAAPSQYPTSPAIPPAAPTVSSSVAAFGNPVNVPTTYNTYALAVAALPALQAANPNAKLAIFQYGVDLTGGPPIIGIVSGT